VVLAGRVPVVAAVKFPPPVLSELPGLLDVLIVWIAVPPVLAAYTSIWELLTVPVANVVHEAVRIRRPKLIVPLTAPVLATDRVSVRPLTAVTVAPAPIPVPDTVDPTAPLIAALPLKAMVKAPLVPDEPVFVAVTVLGDTPTLVTNGDAHVAARRGDVVTPAGSDAVYAVTSMYAVMLLLRTRLVKLVMLQVTAVVVVQDPIRFPPVSAE
jgi:hypothetical protein